MFDPFTILAGLIPVLTEAGKAAVNRWITPDQFKPSNIGEYVSLREADLKLFQAINGAGGNGLTYQWVEAIKQLQRPFVVAVVLSTWAVGHSFGVFEAGALQMVDNFASSVGFYLFADRTLFYVQQRSPQK